MNMKEKALISMKSVLFSYADYVLLIICSWMYHSCFVDFPMQCRTCSFNSVLGVLPCSEQYFLKASASSFLTLHPRVAMCSRLYLLDAFFYASLTAISPPPLVIVLYMENVELTIYIMHKLYG